MSHLPLDARAILQHLNELGYRNISAEQLREFLKDLRKLIKHDERLASTSSKGDYFSSLHKRETVSSRAKIGERDKENAPLEQATLQAQLKGVERKTGGNKNPSSDKGTDTLSLAYLLQNTLTLDNAPKKAMGERRSRSKTRSKHPKQLPRVASSDESEPAQRKHSLGRSKLRRTSRPRSTGRYSTTMVSAQAKQRLRNPQNDPVALYHYYQKEWAHFREQIPGGHKPKTVPK